MRFWRFQAAIILLILVVGVTPGGRWLADGGPGEPPVEPPAAPEPPAAGPQPDTPFGQLQAGLEAIAGQGRGTFAFAVLDLLTGDRIVVGDTAVFHPASTIKVPLVMYLYQLAAGGQINLQERMVFTPADDEGGTGLLRYRGVGGSYTLAQLADYTIRYSDNVAKNMLTRRLGWENITAFAGSLGAAEAWDQRRTRVADALGYLAALYAQREQPHFAQLIDQMQRTVFAPRLGHGFPPGVPVAHKIGTQAGGQFHDVALVLLEGRPFAMAGFSRGVGSERAAIQVLGQAGQLALAHFQSLSQPPRIRVGSQPLAGGLMDGFNRTQIPVRALAEGLGATVTWDAAAGAAVVITPYHTLTLRPGEQTAMRDGWPVHLDRAPFLVEGRIYAPLRSVAEALDAQVVWDSELQEVVITPRP